MRAVATAGTIKEVGNGTMKARKAIPKNENVIVARRERAT
jgi:hypothetical protein